MHACEECFRDGHDHPELCGDCGERHWPPPCCEGCPCGSWDSYHRPLAEAGVLTTMAETAPRPPKGGRMKKLVLATLALALAGCGQAVATVQPAGAQPTQPPAVAEPTDIALPPVATDEPAGQPTSYQPGDVITITANGADWATIVVDRVKVVASYKGAYYTDKPAAGNVYIQARITYTAKTNAVSYNPFDWQVFVGGVAVENFTVVLNGPKPELGSGDLPNGRIASGYVVYEVAKTGKVLLSYKGGTFTNDAPVFEVVLRSK